MPLDDDELFPSGMVYQIPAEAGSHPFRVTFSRDLQAEIAPRIEAEIATTRSVIDEEFHNVRKEIIEIRNELYGYIRYLENRIDDLSKTLSWENCILNGVQKKE